MSTKAGQVQSSLAAIKRKASTGEASRLFTQGVLSASAFLRIDAEDSRNPTIGKVGLDHC